MGHLSSAVSIASSTPWWAVPAATLAGVIITVAATITLEVFRAKRDREARLSDERHKSYSEIADLVRSQMSLLNSAHKALGEKGNTATEDRESLATVETRQLHRRAAILASLVGSAELVEAIDFQYQCILEAWNIILRTLREQTPYYSLGAKSIVPKVEKAEDASLRVINVLRQDMGVPGSLRHQWF